jgi:phosphoglycolate phosphatase
MKKGILFDLDGTLWDSSGVVIESWNNTIANHTDLGLTFTQEQMRSYMGKTLDQIGDLMFPMLPPEERLNLMRICSREENEFLKTANPYIYPGEKEVLEKLSKDHLLAVVSNCQDGYIEIFLEKCGFGGLFGDFECAGRTGLDKGDNIKLVAQRNGLEKCFYLGDTEMDGAAARKAGVPFIHAAYGFGSPAGFDARINNISELAAAVAALE